MSESNREKQLEEALSDFLEGWLSLDNRVFLESEWEVMDEAEEKARQLLDRPSINREKADAA